MIQAIGINLTPKIRQQSQLKAVQFTEEASPVQMELSGSEVGRAMLAGMGINFKGSAEPIDVTDKLNKKVEGKSHLELPNLKVYDYPDTNLRVFIDKKSMTSQNIQFSFTLSKKHSPEKDVLLEGLIIQMLNGSLNSKINDICVEQYTKKLLKVEGSLKNVDYRKLEEIGKELTNYNFTEERLIYAKERITRDILDEYNKQKQESLSNFEGWRSNEELLLSLDKITVEELSSYYKKCLVEGFGQFVIKIDGTFYDENEPFILESINNGFDNKFSHQENVVKDERNSFVLDNTKVVFDTESNIFEAHYPCVNSSLKDKLIGEIATMMFFFTSLACLHDFRFTNYNGIYNLPSPPDVAHTFVFEGESVLTPDEIRELSPAVRDFIYYSGLEFKEGWETQENTLISIKDFLKEQLQREMKDAHLSNKILDYGSSIFDAYELIDSITLDDVKEYVTKHIMNPVITSSTERLVGLEN